MTYITIYNWTKWDNIAGKTIHGPRKGTLDAISTCGGIPIMDSSEEVDETDMDGDGFVKKDK